MNSYFNHEFVRALVDLKLWYIWFLVTARETAFHDALKWADFYDKSVFKGAEQGGDGSDVEGWHSVSSALERLLADGRDAPADGFQKRGMDLVWPCIEPALDDRIAMLDKRWEKGVIGCFRYEYRTSYSGTNKNEVLTLHFRNTMRPESPFHNRTRLIDSLWEIVERTCDARPHVAEAQMGSWLNGFPPLASLFPRPWAENARVANPGGHMGWWGQFMDRKGGLHTGHVRQFKDRGEFPFQSLSCRCTVQELREHLQHTRTEV